MGGGTWDTLPQPARFQLESHHPTPAASGGQRTSRARARGWGDHGDLARDGAWWPSPAATPAACTDMDTGTDTNTLSVCFAFVPAGKELLHQPPPPLPPLSKMSLSGPKMVQGSSWPWNRVWGASGGTGVLGQGAACNPKTHRCPWDMGVRGQGCGTRRVPPRWRRQQQRIAAVGGCHQPCSPPQSYIPRTGTALGLGCPHTPLCSLPWQCTYIPPPTPPCTLNPCTPTRQCSPVTACISASHVPLNPSVPPYPRAPPNPPSSPTPQCKSMSSQCIPASPM